MPRGPLSSSSLGALALLLCQLSCSSARPPAGEPASVDSAPPASTAHGPPPAPPTSAFIAAPAMPGVNVPAIKVDTVGYPAAWRKIAIFNVEPKGAVVKAE